MIHRLRHPLTVNRNNEILLIVTVVVRSDDLSMVVLLRYSN